MAKRKLSICQYKTQAQEVGMKQTGNSREMGVKHSFEVISFILT